MTWIVNSGGAPLVAANFDPYTTSIPATEANFSESGKWTRGDNTGLNTATGPQTTGGSPGVIFAHAGDGTDYLATFQGRFNPQRHFVQFVAQLKAGYTAPSTQEVEALVGFSLTAGEAKGYELDFAFPGSPFQQVRWNDDGGGTQTYDFTAVVPAAGDPNLWPGQLADGDVVRVEFDSTSGSPIITLKLNGTVVNIFTDTSAGKITSGSPGVGMFVQPGAGLDLTGYCVRGNVVVGSL